MFKHRRVRVGGVLLSGWVVLAAVERWVEGAAWPTAVAAGFSWACVVAGVWWFAEWTQAQETKADAARAVIPAPSDGERAKAATPAAAPQDGPPATGEASAGPPPRVPNRSGAQARDGAPES